MSTKFNLLICIIFYFSNAMHQDNSENNLLIDSSMIQSLLSLNTTSIMLPITHTNNQWIVSSSSVFATCSNTLSTEHNFVLLPLFLRHLSSSIQNTSIHTMKLHITFRYDITQTHIHQLSQILSNLQDNIHITEIIVPSNMLAMMIKSLVSEHNITITTYFDTAITVPSKRRKLLTNITNTSVTLIPMESWVCSPWPIYVGFFCGIGVTVVVTVAIRFSMGDKDAELINALEKVVTTGISSEFDEFDPNGNNDGFPEINLFSLRRARSQRSVSEHIGTPRNRTRSRAASKRMRENRKQVASLSLNQFNDSINTNNTAATHERKVTFADEMRASQTLEHALRDSEDDMEIKIRLPVLPAAGTTLGTLPSAHEVSPDDGAFIDMFSDAVHDLGGASMDSLSFVNNNNNNIKHKEIEIVVEDEEDIMKDMHIPRIAAIQSVLSHSCSVEDDVEDIVDFIQNEIIPSEVINSEEEMA